MHMYHVQIATWYSELNMYNVCMCIIWHYTCTCMCFDNMWSVKCCAYWNYCHRLVLICVTVRHFCPGPPSIT